MHVVAEAERWLAELTSFIQKAEATLRSYHGVKQKDNLELSRLKAMALAEMVKQKLAEPTVDYDDPLLKNGIALLVSCKEYVKPLCGGGWTTWSAPGTCQQCSIPIDRKEKGLHCTNGGHRICWTCMVKNIDWTKVITKDPDKFKNLGFEVPGSGDGLCFFCKVEQLEQCVPCAA